MKDSRSILMFTPPFAMTISTRASMYFTTDDFGPCVS